jgi:hypothetical protein
MISMLNKNLAIKAGILDDQPRKLAQFEIEPSNRLVSVANQRYVINPYSLGWWSYRV